jgi:glycosyltransferase involved in cell wall biosynthesis
VPITEQNWGYVAPLVSVLCPTYNHEKFISQCFDGFLIQQTSFPIEIIVRDDASTDGTANIISTYAARYPHLFRILLYAENQFRQGLRALPSMLPLARGDYVAVCEGDDYWISPRKLEKQVAALENNPKCVGVFHPALMLHEKSGEIINGHFYGPPFKAPQFTLDDLLEHATCFIPTCSFLTRLNHRTEFLRFEEDRIHLRRQGVGTWNTDYPFHVINAMNGTYAFIDEAMAVYRIHPQGIYSGLSELEKLTVSPSTLHLATTLGLKQRRSFKNGMASRYVRLRAFQAANWNAKETVRATMKAIYYAPWRRWPRIILSECRFLTAWLKARVNRGFSKP